MFFLSINCSLSSQIGRNRRFWQQSLLLTKKQQICMKNYIQSKCHNLTFAFCRFLGLFLSILMFFLQKKPFYLHLKDISEKKSKFIYFWHVV